MLARLWREKREAQSRKTKPFLSHISVHCSSIKIGLGTFITRLGFLWGGLSVQSPFWNISVSKSEDQDNTWSEREMSLTALTNISRLTCCSMKGFRIGLYWRSCSLLWEQRWIYGWQLLYNKNYIFMDMKEKIVANSGTATQWKDVFYASCKTGRTKRLSDYGRDGICRA